MALQFQKEDSLNSKHTHTHKHTNTQTFKTGKTLPLRLFKCL